MAQKRRRAKAVKNDKLIPLQWSSERPWYHAPLSLAATGLSRLLRLFRQPQEIPRAAPRRRKM
jgi:hypothetical protein